MFLTVTVLPKEPSKPFPKKSEIDKESEPLSPTKQDKPVSSRLPKQSDNIDDKETLGRASDNLTSGVSKLPTRDQRSSSKEKSRNDSPPENSEQESNQNAQTKTVIDTSESAAADLVEDSVGDVRLASTEKGEINLKDKKSGTSEIKLGEKDTAKLEASITTTSLKTEEISDVAPIQSGDEKTEEVSKLKVTPATSDVLPSSEVGKESRSDPLAADVNKTDMPGTKSETKQSAKAESPSENTAEIPSKNATPEQEKVPQTKIRTEDLKEKEIKETEKLIDDLKPKEKASTDPALLVQETVPAPEEKTNISTTPVLVDSIRSGQEVGMSLKKAEEVTSDQNKGRSSLPPNLASEDKVVEPKPVPSDTPVSPSVNADLVSEEQPEKLLTDQNTSPADEKMPTLSRDLTEPKVEEESVKEVGSKILTETVTVWAKNVENQVDKEALLPPGQQKDSNERQSDPAVENTDSLDSCRKEAKAIIMEDGAEENVSKPEKPALLPSEGTILKPDTAKEEPQAVDTDAQEEKNKTNVMEKEQGNKSKPTVSDTVEEGKISIENKTESVDEKTELQTRAIAVSDEKESKGLQSKGEEIAITKPNLEEKQTDTIKDSQTIELKASSTEDITIKEENDKRTISENTPAEIPNKPADIEASPLRDQMPSVTTVTDEDINKPVEDTSLSATSKSLSTNLDKKTETGKVPEKTSQIQVPQVDTTPETEETKSAKVTKEESETKEASTKNLVINTETGNSKVGVEDHTSVIGTGNDQNKDNLLIKSENTDLEEKPLSGTEKSAEVTNLPENESANSSCNQEVSIKQHQEPVVVNDKDDEQNKTKGPDADLETDPKTGTEEDAKLREKSSVHTAEKVSKKTENTEKQDVVRGKDDEQYKTKGANLDKEPKTGTKEDNELHEKSSVHTTGKVSKKTDNTEKQEKLLKKDREVENKETKKEDQSGKVSKTEVQPHSEQICIEVASSQNGGEDQKDKITAADKMVTSTDAEKNDDDASKLLTKDEQVKDKKLKDATKPKEFTIKTEDAKELRETSESKTVGESKTVDTQISTTDELNTLTARVQDEIIDENKNKATDSSVQSLAIETANKSDNGKTAEQQDQASVTLKPKGKDVTEVDKNKSAKAKLEEEATTATKDSAKTAKDSKLPEKSSEPKKNKEAKKTKPEKEQKQKKKTIPKGVENEGTKQVDQQVKPPTSDKKPESETSLSKSSGEQQKDKISVVPVESLTSTGAEKKDKDEEVGDNKLKKDTTKEVKESQTTEVKPLSTKKEDSQEESKTGAVGEKISNTADTKVSPPKAETAKLQEKDINKAEKNTSSSTQSPKADVEEKTEQRKDPEKTAGSFKTDTAQQVNEAKSVEVVKEDSGATESSVKILSHETTTVIEVQKVRVLQDQKPGIQEKGPDANLEDAGTKEASKETTLPENKTADGNREVQPNQKSLILCDQDKGITKSDKIQGPKTNLEEKLKTGEKESTVPANSPNKSSALTNDKTTKTDKKQKKDLIKDVAEVKSKETKQGSQKKSKKEEDKAKVRIHSDAKEKGETTKVQTKTSLGSKTELLPLTKDRTVNLREPQKPEKPNVSDSLPAAVKKSAPSLQLSKESPSSWLDVEHHPKKKKEQRRKLESSASEDESVDPDDFDSFVKSIKEGSIPFSQPLKKHVRKRSLSPAFAMPAIREVNFDPESFQFGLGKEATIFRDPLPAAVMKQNAASRKGQVQEKPSRDNAKDAAGDQLKSPDQVDSKDGVKGGVNAGKQERPVNGEEPGKLTSRLERISILSSLLSSPWSSRKAKEEVGQEDPPTRGRAGVPSPLSIEADKDGAKGKSQSPAVGGGVSALSDLALSPTSPPPLASFSDIKLPSHLEKYLKKNKSESETSQASEESSQTSPKGNTGKNKASMAGAPNSRKSSINELSTSKHKVRPGLCA